MKYGKTRVVMGTSKSKKMSVERGRRPVSINYEHVASLLSLDSKALLKQCKITRQQASGPGGQKRNRVYSAVRLCHPKSGLESTACESRQAAVNLASALHKLRLKTALLVTRQEEAAQPGNTGDAFPALPRDWPPFRTQIHAKHRDYPCLVFHAFRLLYIKHGAVSVAASDLGVSTSALIKFFRKDKTVWNALQSARALFKKTPLKDP
jgi:hypothetical protein